MMVWDGMRPDFVTPQYTPNLYALSQKGVFFARHHPVYPSSTEVNGTALATGLYPGHSGLIGNKEYRPEVDPLAAFATESPEAIHATDAKGAYLAGKTVAEILHANGFPTAVAGTKGVAILHDRSDKKTTPAEQASGTVYEGQATTPATLAAVEQAQGKLPEPVTYPNSKQDTWTTDALTKVLWKNGVPKFSVLWMSDVDYSQHDAAPGSPTAIAALKSVDDRLGTVLSVLDAKGVRDKTTILVVSDHGFSTIGRQLNMYDELKAGGFQAPKTFTAPPKQGEIVIVGLGGSVLFYVGGHDKVVTQKLTDFLLNKDYAGPVFTKEALPGTFALSQVKIDKVGAPDVVLSFNWTKANNAFGTPGIINAEGSRKVGQGTHVTLSPYDMHNTLVGAGPDFKVGFTNQTPSGNIDVAPTILYLLGITAPQPMDGRVLTEALANGPVTAPEVRSGRVESTSSINGQQRRQYLQWVQVDGATYFDEGGAEFVAARRAQ